MKILKQRSTWAGLATIALTIGQIAGDAVTGGAVSGAIGAVGIIGGALGLLDDDKVKNERVSTVSD
ncbi:hypothetical protein [Vibrio nigripulchritudo]|uniref:hypothetical protein n=1 Tax=Vibrio nigripulchritudo TaxID=28173 RepID=UPI002491FDA0|nr:hypothetical protein [Vibrio nigripulchritudo]BDU42901.1 hypothetical protein TUMSATVNIG3_16990 [Vibrio nigripulchritudo]